MKPLPSKNREGLDTVIREIERHGVVEPYYGAFAQLVGMNQQQGYDVHAYARRLFDYTQQMGEKCHSEYAQRTA